MVSFSNNRQLYKDQLIPLDVVWQNIEMHLTSANNQCLIKCQPFVNGQSPITILGIQ